MATRERCPLLPRDLPDGRALLDAGRRLGEGITVGRSLLSQTHGVRSEVEYRRKMAASGRLMTCMNIGLKTWDDTARALESIHAETERRGFRIDRYQLNLDRRMGLPPRLWDQVPKETGPTLETPAHWRGIAHTVPIQPHLGDMMIGSPMSVDNARRALEAGVTYIGNMSQFAWRYPVWSGTDVEQVAETVKALGLVAARQDDDATLHSYLDDGYAAQFNDFCSYIGWSLIERHVVDDIVGARVATAYGGLTRRPAVKAAMILALDAIKAEGTYNTFYHGNTTAYTEAIDANFGVLSVDVLYMILAQMRTGGGTPVLPIPVTEALRVPAWEEIVQAHTVARSIAAQAGSLLDVVDWSEIDALRDRLVEGGRRFYENVLEGLADLGVDTDDPMALLLALRRLGGVEIERRFGVGEAPVDSTEVRRPLVPTDTFEDFIDRQQVVRRAAGGRRVDAPVRLVVGSSDVHEYAMMLVVDALRALAVEPVVAGVSVDPEDLAEQALESAADVVLVSTHNGMALTYARQLRQALTARGIAPVVAMGGTLNEDMDGYDTPVDLDDELRQLGVKVCTEVTDVFDLVGASRT